MLLPRDYGDLPSYCSCPDWSDPCKHIAACLYLLAEERFLTTLGSEPSTPEHGE